MIIIAIIIIFVSKTKDFTPCRIHHGFSTFHAKQSPFHTNPCLWSETTSAIVLFHMSFWLSTRSEVHPTPTPAYGAKQDLTYKNCFVNNFLINNKNRKKSITLTSLKIKININQSEVIWNWLCKDKDLLLHDL